MPIDSADGAPDVGLELGGGRVDHIPEVDLVGQLGEGGQERLDGGIGASGREVLEFAVDRCFHIFRKDGHLREE